MFSSRSHGQSRQRDVTVRICDRPPGVDRGEFLRRRRRFRPVYCRRRRTGHCKSSTCIMTHPAQGPSPVSATRSPGESWSSRLRTAESTGSCMRRKREPGRRDSARPPTSSSISCLIRLVARHRAAVARGTRRTPGHAPTADVGKCKLGTPPRCGRSMASTPSPALLTRTHKPSRDVRVSAIAC
jgi:hypothetical protein